MSTPYVAVTILAAAAVGYSAFAALRGAQWVVANLSGYGVPQSWLPWLGALKAAGALGLLVGLVVPTIGDMAAIALIIYFIGAALTVAHARWFSHIPYPIIFLAPVAVSLALRVAV